MSKLVNMAVAIAVLAATLFVAGCSSSPSEEEMAQLNDLKRGNQSLQKSINDRNGEKSALEKQIADKNGKLQLCQSDQQAVKTALGK